MNIVIKKNFSSDKYVNLDIQDFEAVEKGSWLQL
jgi:hypothetical protein